MTAPMFGNETSDRIDGLLDELWKTQGWKRDPERDRAFLVELTEQFPGLILADEFEKWRVWLIAHGTGTEGRSRGRYQRIRTWCTRAGQYARGRTGGTGRPVRRTGTAPRTAAEFGDTSVSLSSW